MRKKNVNYKAVDHEMTEVSFSNVPGIPSGAKITIILPRKLADLL